MTKLDRSLVVCRKCPRLVRWRETVAQEKRAAFRAEEYWGQPVPGFGDLGGELLIVGLAPAAHGANRTGRMFTGDRSGEWLYGALHRAGYANQAESISRGDGLQLRGAYVSAVVRCAPPANQPTPAERDRCLPYLESEIRQMANLSTIVALGAFAWDGVLRALKGLGHSLPKRPKFGHGREVKIGPYQLIGSYHPSQQNTFTGKLTRPMFDAVFQWRHSSFFAKPLKLR